jgi:hypothetical protein
VCDITALTRPQVQPLASRQRPERGLFQACDEIECRNISLAGSGCLIGNRDGDSVPRPGIKDGKRHVGPSALSAHTFPKESCHSVNAGKLERQYPLQASASCLSPIAARTRDEAKPADSRISIFPDVTRMNG